MPESACLVTYGKTWRKKVTMEGGNIRKRYVSDSRKGQYFKNPAQQWDEEYKKVIEERRRDKFKEWRSNKNMKNFIEYNKAKAVARKIIKQKKQQDFKKFAMSLNKNISTTYVWHKMSVVKQI